MNLGFQSGPSAGAAFRHFVHPCTGVVSCKLYLSQLGFVLAIPSFAIQPIQPFPFKRIYLTDVVVGIR